LTGGERSERSGSALSYVTDRSVRGLSEGVQGLEVVTPVLPIDKGKGCEVEALLVEPTPEPVPSSEEEEDEEEETLESSVPILHCWSASQYHKYMVNGQVWWACAQHF